MPGDPGDAEDVALGGVAGGHRGCRRGTHPHARASHRAPVGDGFVGDVDHARRTVLVQMRQVTHESSVPRVSPQGLRRIPAFGCQEDFARAHFAQRPPRRNGSRALRGAVILMRV